jgi:hypothetical protein
MLLLLLVVVAVAAMRMIQFHLPETLKVLGWMQRSKVIPNDSS